MKRDQVHKNLVSLGFIASLDVLINEDGLPSGSITTKLAGPVVRSSASLANSIPWAFSWRCSSRTSVNVSSFWAS
jgi:hypothetical protein